MEEKDKQIEEIEKLLLDRIINKTWRANKVAKELYEMIIPEGAVVLTAEYFQRIINQINEQKKDIEAYDILEESYERLLCSKEKYIEYLQCKLNAANVIYRSGL